MGGGEGQLRSYHSQAGAPKTVVVEYDGGRPGRFDDNALGLPSWQPSPSPKGKSFTPERVFSFGRGCHQGPPTIQRSAGV